LILFFTILQHTHVSLRLPQFLVLLQVTSFQFLVTQDVIKSLFLGGSGLPLTLKLSEDDVSGICLVFSRPLSMNSNECVAKLEGFPNQKPTVFRA
jgi:hypothetical protein